MTDRPKVDDLDLCIVHTGDGERMSDALAVLLDPVDPATFHEYVLPAGTPVELHSHDYDEYWWFTRGAPEVTLWTEGGGHRRYRLGPGDLVACVRGVAHTLRADHDLSYYQFSSFRRTDAREGHLTPMELKGAIEPPVPPSMSGKDPAEGGDTPR